MADGICLKCGSTVESEDISREFFPAIHRECGGEIAVHIDIGERIREVLQPREPVMKPELGPPPGYLSKVLLDVNHDSPVEMFIRRMYGINVRLFDLTGGEQREIPLKDAVKLVRAYEERDGR